MASLEIYQVDAFTDKPFGGNPAAVCILHEPTTDDWMQAVAGEMNLSETAFLRQQADGFDLRWFTPVVEVDLCGHATLASAHVLWETGYLWVSDEARFHTRSGLLTARLQENLIELDFPTTPAEECSPAPGLIEALGVEPRFVGKNRFDYLVRVGSEAEVRAAHPDFVALSHIRVRGVMITSEADSNEYDFVSRFFAPRSGINEDPVTGSAHCCLGPFWSSVLGKQEFVAYQASSAGRRGAGTA